MTLGQKLRRFRKLAQLSQLGLETEIGASSGTISRIENGEVNPTKETILKISETLKLNQKEKLSLLGLDEGEPTETEVKKVIAEFQDYFSRSDIFALLLDQKEYVILVSQGILNLIPTTKEKLPLLPLHLLEIIFNPDIGISQLLENKENYYIHELAFLRANWGNQLEEKWLKDLISNLMNYPSFEKCWKESVNVKEPFLGPMLRKVQLNVNGRVVTFTAHFRHLNIDPRFELIEYYLDR